MGKYIKYIIAVVFLVIFGILAFNVYKGNEMIMDSTIYNFISENLISDEMTPFIKFITNFGGALCVVVITVVSFFIFKNKKINISIVINLICGALLNNILKLIFMRPRPEIGVLVEESTYSFPSGHSMVSIIFYGYFIYLIYHLCKNKIVKWFLITILSILILIIGFSRIYLGAHYASDVVSAYAVGISYLIFYTKITKKAIK